MNDFWNRIRALEGTTLYTSARHRAFDIGKVNDDQVWYAPQSTAKERWSSRQNFETLINLGLKPSDMTRAYIAEQIPNDVQNSSYIHAILVAIGKAM